jgi:hypothetical protein
MKHAVLTPLTRGVALCALLGMVACDEPTALADLQPFFDASPDTVAPGDTVEVTFTLRNPTPYPRTIVSSVGCLFFLHTYVEDREIPWKGTDYGCIPEGGYRTIPKGDSLHYVLELIAATVGSNATTLPEGTYRIRTEMNTTQLPDLETEVTVVAHRSN